ncbi:MAG: hypothetical protein OJF55_002302 [Rhodanobacteraceae bacterium]|nr:MAG: hypothetical protein OJF55_002302 [Rhodanobacteraceae bacterium]
MILLFAPCVVRCAVLRAAHGGCPREPAHRAAGVVVILAACFQADHP